MVFWSIWKGENINQEYINLKKKIHLFFLLAPNISKIVPDHFWKNFSTHQKRKFDDAVFAHHRSRDHHNSNGVFKSVQLALAEVKISSKSWCTQFMNVFKKLFFGTTTGLCLNFDQWTLVSLIRQCEKVRRNFKVFDRSSPEQPELCAALGKWRFCALAFYYCCYFVMWFHKIFPIIGWMSRNISFWDDEDSMTVAFSSVIQHKEHHGSTS